MNGVMAGMEVVMVLWMHLRPMAASPARGEFWFMMALALIAGAAVAYPLNWWLVSHDLKHGLMSTAGGTMPTHAAPTSTAQGHRVHGSEVASAVDPHVGHPVAQTSPYRNPVTWISGGLLAAVLAFAQWMH